jgi:hypothetical protein
MTALGTRMSAKAEVPWNEWLTLLILAFFYEHFCGAIFALKKVVFGTYSLTIPSSNNRLQNGPRIGRFRPVLGHVPFLSNIRSFFGEH